VADVGTDGGSGLSRQPGLRRCFEVDRRDLGVTRVKVVRHAGFDTVDDVYQAVLNNAVSSPAEAHLINLTGRR
jgi:hypothetical protein